MIKNTCAWLVAIMGIAWGISGNIEVASTCWGTALILSNIEDK